jgi:PKD repeat protein
MKFFLIPLKILGAIKFFIIRVFIHFSLLINQFCAMCKSILYNFIDINLRILILFCFIFFLSDCIISQTIDNSRRDYVWPMGYDYFPQMVGIDAVTFDFRGIDNGDTMKIIYGQQDFDMNKVNASVCDENGNLLLYTNGCVFADNNRKQILLNDTINKTNANFIVCGGNLGLGCSRESMLLPDNYDSTIFHLITEPLSSFNFGAAADKIKYNKIKFKNQESETLINDFDIKSFNPSSLYDFSFLLSHLSACIHGNGKDWWIITPVIGSNIFLKLLLSKDTIVVNDSQNIGVPFVQGDACIGNSVFSPDGTKFADYSINSDIQIFDFDRCTGLLSNPIHILLYDAADTLQAAGCAFSNNSRFLYIASSTKVYQVDMQAPYIQSSITRVATYDGYVDEYPQFRMLFYQMQLAPDNKIYMTSSGGRTNFHVIEHPDSLGVACKVVQHKQMLNTAIAGGGFPNFPYFRLGAMDVPCAYPTPIADFVWSVSDTLSPLSVVFNNLSLQSSNPHPVSWTWDFGDGNSSTIKNPMHTYVASGTYQVCLIAYNQEGADTLCQTVIVTLVGLSEVGNVGSLRLKTMPNPTTGSFWYETNAPIESQWQITNLLGKIVKTGKTESTYWTRIDLYDLALGCYNLTILEKTPVSKLIVKQ